MEAIPRICTAERTYRRQVGDAVVAKGLAPRGQEDAWVSLRCFGGKG